MIAFLAEHAGFFGGVFVVVFLVETPLLWLGVRAYYETGIRVLGTRASFGKSRARLPSPEEMTVRLEEQGIGSEFHQLQPNLYGFRTFNRSSWKSGPFHGTLRLDESGPQVEVVGRLNWSVPAFVLVAVALASIRFAPAAQGSLDGRISAGIALAILLVFLLLSILRERSEYLKVAQAAAD